jgi:hypothetical protein
MPSNDRSRPVKEVEGGSKKATIAADVNTKSNAAAQLPTTHTNPVHLPSRHLNHAEGDPCNQT